MSRQQAGKTARIAGYTPPYQGSEDDYNVLEDPKHGYDVPDSVREGGAYKPMERVELSGNGVSIRADTFAYECTECGHIQRLASCTFKEFYNCQGCNEAQWFRFDWELNRPFEAETKRGDSDV